MIQKKEDMEATIYFEGPGVTVWHGDCLDVMRAMPDDSVHSIVTDPPYGLEFMGSSWDAPWKRGDDINADAGMSSTGYSDGGRRLDRPSFTGSTNPKCMQCGGTRRGRRDGTAKVAVCLCENGGRFPNVRAAEMRAFQDWCSEWTAEALRVLKPGGHLVAFGGSRTWHRLAVAVEDAGFELRDSIAWLYAQGFPKSVNVEKAVAGHELGFGLNSGAIRRASMGADYVESGVRGNRDGVTRKDTGVAGRDMPSSDNSLDWRGWGTALKPAFEPVVCARKPFNAVSLDWRLVTSVHHALAGLLWLSLSPAKRAELSSPSSRAELGEAWCASALVSAALGTSPEGFAAMGTCNSPALVSTSSSIASSWSSILGALSAPTRTFTTSTASSTTTALRTLNSLLAPITSQTTMPPCGCLLGGSASTVASAESSSTDEWASWLHTLSASAPESAIEGIAVAAASVCAQVVESLSDDLGAGSSAAPSATTGADASGSPAFEPIVVARKPLSGTVAGNVLAHGTGALNIDATRIATSDDLAPAGGEKVTSNTVFGSGLGVPSGRSAEPAGRWPTNVVLDDSQAAALDEQSGTLASGVMRAGTQRQARDGAVYGRLDADATPRDTYGASGGASRFFPTFRYEAKAPSSERPEVDGVQHPTVKPVDLMRWLVRLVTPPGGTVLEPFAGSGTTLEAALAEGFDVIGVELTAEYLPLIRKRFTKPIDVAFDLGDFE